ncbi:helix-turn-helix domain-containing protein [Scatolibacter rhodanostii]|uniref:helix-turn-helix domain-containing protein n=1 Tax=Scatolibacter rhodanostii TaxID=2014781 RepID=UPI000C06DDBF|nr:helix-turn-helix transcriptional regulator [Scatolibacter rhodanostii]
MYEIFERIISEKGITPYKVWKETGVSQTTLSSWKKGTYVPKLETLEKIANFLEVDVHYLNGEKLPYCHLCGLQYLMDSNEDKKIHKIKHKKWELAVKKFGFCWPYRVRESIKSANDSIQQDESKNISERCEAALRMIKAYFSRSLETNDYDLSHISFEEYIPYFLGEQVSRFDSAVQKALTEKYGKKEGMEGTYWKIPNKKESITNKIKKLVPKRDEPEITFDDFTYAFLDESKELTEENKQKLLEMAKFFKQQQEKDN